MSGQELKAKVAELLLAELKSENDATHGWYYISAVHTPTNTFRGGFYVYAAGPTDAWCKYHQLNWHEPGCETLTTGPVSDEQMDEHVPPELRWRKLTKAEVTGDSE